MRVRRAVAEVASWSGPQWRLAAEAGLGLVAARLAVWFVPFRRLAAGVGDLMAESPTDETEEQRASAASVGWAVRGLGRELPFMKQCLVQALAATWMLQRRRVPCTLYFGLAKGLDAELEAHAWVRSGTKVLIGAQEMHAFKIVATFAGPRVRPEADCAQPR
jgi:hypothetical protein